VVQRRLFGPYRAVATKSRQSVTTAYCASDAASNRWLLRPNCRTLTPDRARNRRHDSPGSAVAVSVPPRRFLDEIELRRPNRAKVPQEHTPHQMQRQVAGSSAPGASHRPLIAPRTAVTTKLRMLLSASAANRCFFDEIELRRPNRGNARQEHTPHRMQPQVGGSSVPTAAH
jgi:hypothetical protein